MPEARKRYPVDPADKKDASTKSPSEEDDVLSGCVVFVALILVLIGIALSSFVNAIVMACYFLGEVIHFLKYGGPIEPTLVGDVAVFPLSNLLNSTVKHDWYFVREIARFINSWPVMIGATIFGVLSFLAVTPLFLLKDLWEFCTKKY